MKAKKIIALLMTSIMAVGVLAGCNGDAGNTPAAGGDTSSNTAGDTTGDGTGDEPVTGQVTVDDAVGTINLWAFTDEVPGMIQAYVDAHPDFKYNVETTIVATTDGAYQPALDQALIAGGDTAPDIFCAEAAFVLKYTQGDMCSYACPYEDLGIDMSALDTAAIAPYSVEIGTNPDGKVVGLGYQATGGAFIYRRSVAEATWGTDDPATVAEKIGGGSGSWDQFWVAAEDLKAEGYAIISGDGDIWHAIENSSDTGWIVDGKLNIDPKREAFLDVAKKLHDNGYYNETVDWQDAWFADMKGEGEKQVLGFFGPAWLINYTLGDNCGGKAVGEGTYGDWAVCESPVGFFWGGTWIIPTTYATADADKAAAVAEIVNYITLDDSQDGLQYAWANGLLNDAGTKDSVASGTVMDMSDGSIDFLGGQNMFDVFVPANAAANGKNLTQYDETINSYWRDQVRAYVAGDKTRDEAIEAFKQQVADNLDVIVE